MTSQDTQPEKLYAAREPVFPRRVSGKFRTLKWWIMAITLGIYYLTPWIRWDRGPNLPDQAVLVDMAGRRFYFFMIEIWPHEFYFVAGLLVMAGIGLFLFTSALGRVWCGYTCPQTVWTDLFILVERWIEGDRNARIRLWNAPWDARKARLRLTKWFVWLLIGLATGGAWVFYFADAPTLLHDLLTGQAAFVAYASIAVLTFTTFVFGGFMREQVCIYMCPWPRIQAAMMDKDTLTVAYRSWRGEPRGKGKRRREIAESAMATAQAAGPQAGRRSPNIPMPGLQTGPVAASPLDAEHDTYGDCIDCNACVNVCPTGIDIRDGQQLACITCALCIDACDDVMAKIGKPRGLIDYITLKDEDRERAGQEPIPAWKHIFHLRTILYTALWAAIGVALVVALFIRSDITANISPIRNPQFVTLSDGTIRNDYDIRIRNQQGEARSFDVSLVAPFLFGLEVQGQDGTTIEVPANETITRRLHILAGPENAASSQERVDVRIWLNDTGSDSRTYVDTIYNGNAQ
jgi:polyferredoxin